MINLTEEDKYIINHLGYPKVVSLSSGDFLIKMVSKTVGVKELFGARLGKIMGLIVPNNYLVEVDSNLYILSESLNKNGKFVTAEKEFGGEDRDDFSIFEAWMALEERYGKSTHNVIDIVKVYMFDILFGNSDRTLGNWGFIHFNNGSMRVVILDFEFLLDSSSSLFLHAQDIKHQVEAQADFLRFLRESSSEFIDLFKYYYDLFTLEYFNEVLEDVLMTSGLDDLSIREELEKKYAKKYKVLGSIYEDKGKEAHNGR